MWGKYYPDFINHLCICNVVLIFEPIYRMKKEWRAVFNRHPSALKTIILLKPTG
jgi:hypothetical protein